MKATDLDGFALPLDEEDADAIGPRPPFLPLRATDPFDFQCPPLARAERERTLKTSPMAVHTSNKLFALLAFLGGAHALSSEYVIFFSTFLGPPFLRTGGDSFPRYPPL